MITDKRKLVGFIENGVVVRGYVTEHYLDDEGQEASMPRDVELTPEQIAATFDISGIVL